MAAMSAQIHSDLKTSDLLIQLVADLPGERVSLADLLDGLGERAFGALLLLLAIPNSLPLPSPPGFSTLFGIPMALLAAQMVMGYNRPRLPQFVTKRSFARQDLLAMLTRARPYMAKVERHLRPRLPSLTGRASERPIGLLILLLAIVLALPIVFGNFLPGFAILLLSLGLVEEDGGFILAGIVVAVLAVVVVSSVVLIGVEAITFALFSLLSLF